MSGKIFITGDTHADYSRFSKKNFPIQTELDREDFVIVSGDFGIWDNSPRERFELQQLSNRAFTTLFVDGNHENFNQLYKYPVEKWHGGLIHRVRPGVIHLIRGQVYDIAGKKIFTMGGGSSHDIEDGILNPKDPQIRQKIDQLRRQGKYRYRINGMSWWPEEMPNDMEYNTALENLDACGWKVDYVVSHCCPSSVQDILSSGIFQQDALTIFLEQLRNKLDFQYWFFGHYHADSMYCGRFILQYRNIVDTKDLD